MILWVVQANGKEKQGQMMVQILKDSGIPYREVNVRPFTDTLELGDPIPPGTMPVFWGSSTFMRQILSSEWAKVPTFFYDPDGFHYPNWVRLLKHRMLNGSAEITTFKKAAETWKENVSQRKKFIRPVGDFKDFSGVVMDRDEFLRWYQDIVSNGGYPHLNADTPLVLARPKTILKEWRFFIVKGKIVSSSLYKEGSALKKERGAHNRVTHFVETTLRKYWMPHKTVVMDVAEVRSKSGKDTVLKIIEFNTLNTSGFYDHDVEAIVRAVNDVALEEASKAGLL